MITSKKTLVVLGIIIVCLLMLTQHKHCSDTINTTKVVDHLLVEPNTAEPESDKDVFHNILGPDPYKRYIYYKESSFGDEAYSLDYSVHLKNPESGAYGICQYIPEIHQEKVPDDFYENVYTQDKVCTEYMKERYGNWYDAYQFHIANNWW